MKRRLVNLAAALSLAGLLTVGVLMACSAWGSHWADFRRRQPPQQGGRHSYLHAATIFGRFAFSWSWHSLPPSEHPAHWKEEVGRGWIFACGWNRIGVGGFEPGLVTGVPPPTVGFQFYRASTPEPGGPYEYRLAVVPGWALLLALSILPAVRVRSILRERRRRRAGGCARCGYDLRATPNKCPECGHEVVG